MSCNIKDNDISKLISNIVFTLEYQILEIVIDEDFSRFIVTKDFETPTLGAISAPYGTLKGVDITEFIINNKLLQVSAEYLKNNLEKIIENSNRVSIKFSDNHKWRFYSI